MCPVEENILQRLLAGQNDCLWIDFLDLLEEVTPADVGLISLRKPVLRGAALKNVASVDLLFRNFRSSQQFTEELSRLSDIRNASLVLILAGSLADDHQRRVLRSS